MPKLAANLSFLFTESNFPDRFQAAAEAGFKYVEFHFPYAFKAAELKELLSANGLTQVLFNLPGGNWDVGERGIACNPDRTEEFRDGVALALGYAKALEVQRLNCIVGIRQEQWSFEEQWSTLVENLRYAARLIGREKRQLLIELINMNDFPGFLLNRTDQALQLIAEVRIENLKIQYDMYHIQRTEGKLAETIRNHISEIGHIQIADSPNRQEPGTGEINYTFLLNELDRLGYNGFVGLEYRPSVDTPKSLEWFRVNNFHFG
jgi:hydroxypyruvate isomerase